MPQSTRRKIAIAKTVHGLAKTRPWNIWQNMMRRCNAPKSTSFSKYGGRGIAFDQRWESFVEFWKDMGSGYKDHLTLDRIDNDGPYSKENCRWTDWKQQARNRRSSRAITFEGQERTLVEWAEITGLKRWVISFRIDHLGWSVEKALTTPARAYKK